MSETGPVEEGPVEEGPVEEGPVEEGPVEEGPVEEGPVEEGTADGDAERPPARGPTADASKGGPAFWISAAIGWAIIAAGLRGIFLHRIDTNPSNLVRFVVGGALLHDLLVAPVVILIGVAVARIVPRRLLGPTQAALVVSALVALFSYPLVRAYGLATNNPTSLPHNYAANLAVVLGIVWVTAAGVALLRLQDRGRRRRHQADSATHTSATP